MNEIKLDYRMDRDVNDFFASTPPHLSFTDNEEAYGKSLLREMGIPEGERFVCLAVRDSAYLRYHEPHINYAPYHTYRDSNVNNFLLASQELADRGYYVIRMGARVSQPLRQSNQKILDYATNGTRSDFMDVYLSAKCHFFLTTGTGIDSVAQIFRRPLAIVNNAPVGMSVTWGNSTILLHKHHVDMETGRKLSMSEIFSRGVGYAQSTEKFKECGVDLVENTPEEIRDVAIEMAERLDANWNEGEQEQALQRDFWEKFPSHSLRPSDGLRLHGRIRARYSAKFLYSNPQWLS